MTEDQRDDLIEELSIYEAEPLRSMVREFIKRPKTTDRSESIYDFLAEKIEIRGYWQKVGLQQPGQAR